MTAGRDRRRCRRVTRVAPGFEVARFVGGRQVLVRDLSRAGAAVAGPQRVTPGRTVALQWMAGEVPLRLGARVVRSTVLALAGEAGVEYLVAVEFSTPADALWELATRTG